MCVLGPASLSPRGPRRVAWPVPLRMHPSPSKTRHNSIQARFCAITARRYQSPNRRRSRARPPQTASLPQGARAKAQGSPPAAFNSMSHLLALLRSCKSVKDVVSTFVNDVVSSPSDAPYQISYCPIEVKMRITGCDLTGLDCLVMEHRPNHI